MSKKSLYALSLMLLILLAACGQTEEQTTTPPPDAAAPPPPAPEPVGVTAGTIDVGKAVGPDKRVTAPVSSFAKGDTIYASVDTTGTGTATLKATWTYKKGGQWTPVTDDQIQTITPTGPATTEFHISKPGGWPAGEYQVELFLDGKPIGTKTFTVA